MKETAGWESLRHRLQSQKGRPPPCRGGWRTEGNAWLGKKKQNTVTHFYLRKQKTSFVFLLQVTENKDPRTRRPWGKGRGTLQAPGFPQTDERGGERDDQTCTGARRGQEPGPSRRHAGSYPAPHASEGVILASPPAPKHTRTLEGWPRGKRRSHRVQRHGHILLKRRPRDQIKSIRKMGMRLSIAQEVCHVGHSRLPTSVSL